MGLTSNDRVSDDKASEIIRSVVSNFRSVLRSPILRRPSDYGLEYSEVFFPSQDGIPLEAWFVPCQDSDKLIVMNHPRNFNRYGFPSHLEPYKSFGTWVDPGNAVEVNFIPEIKILHDAGYNVLTYDMRNFGLSGSAQGGLSMNGHFESRDVIGSLQYVLGQASLKDMKIGLFSKCLGCSAMFFAMSKEPDLFQGVRCLVGAQPITAGSTMRKALETQGVFGRLDELSRELGAVSGYDLEDFTPGEWAKSVPIPTYLYGVRNDNFTYNEDLENMYENLPVEQKKLHWITDSTARWSGYLEFQNRPAEILDWFAKYM